MSTVSLLELEAMMGGNWPQPAGRWENDVLWSGIRSQELGSDFSCSCTASDKSKIHDYAIFLPR